MKLKTPENKDYAATIVTIKETHELPGLDNLVGFNALGCQALVSKDTPVGTVGIIFTSETQLSPEYASYNNLYEDGSKNRDEGTKGYLGKNGRIRALKLKGNKSDALFMPLTSLSYIKGLKLADLKDGDVFDEINEKKICNKYIVPKTNKEKRLEKNKTANVFKRVDKKFLPEHYDTDNYFKYSDTIPVGRWVTITQKLHGTSIRVGHTVVARKLTIRDRAAKLVGAQVKDTEMDYVFGSRRVIKDINNPNQQSFYSTDLFTEEGKKLEGVLPENFLVYGELIGWENEAKPIQPGYSYKVPRGERELYIYRVAFINEKGFVVDLSWEQVQEFCRDRGLKTVPELYSGPMPTEGEITTWFIEKKFRADGYPQAVDLDDESPVDEGVCIRVDAMNPYILKAKSPSFREYETKLNDKGIVDIETQEN